MSEEKLKKERVSERKRSVAVFLFGSALPNPSL